MTQVYAPAPTSPLALPPPTTPARINRDVDERSSTGLRRSVPRLLRTCIARAHQYHGYRPVRRTKAFIALGNSVYVGLASFKLAPSTARRAPAIPIRRFNKKAVGPVEQRAPNPRCRALAGLDSARRKRPDNGYDYGQPPRRSGGALLRARDRGRRNLFIRRGSIARVRVPRANPRNRFPHRVVARFGRPSAWRGPTLLRMSRRQPSLMP